jgi:hypothetical protein
MEILAFIGLIAIVILLFVCGGLIGWIIKGIVVIAKFLFEGCCTTIAWIIFGIIIFGILLAL